MFGERLLQDFRPGGPTGNSPDREAGIIKHVDSQRPGGPTLRRLRSAVVLLIALFGIGCGSARTVDNGSTADDKLPPENLSAYGLFVGNGATQEPAEGVIPYDLNTPLFYDYT